MYIIYYIHRYILCNVYTIHIIPWCWCWLLLLASYKKAGKPSSHSYNVKVVNDLTNEDHLSFIGKLPVCEEDCILSEWAEWGPCSESCGSDGQQVSLLFVYYLCTYLFIMKTQVVFVFVFDFNLNFFTWKFHQSIINLLFVKSSIFYLIRI